MCDKISGSCGHEILICYKVRDMMGPMSVGQASCESLDDV